MKGSKVAHRKGGSRGRATGWRARAGAAESRERRWRRMLVRLARVVTFLALMAALVFGVAVYVRYDNLAGQFGLGRVGRMPQRSVVYDVNGKVMGRLHGDGRVVVGVDEVSGYFRDALIAREDTRFYRHGGVDWAGVGRAAFRNARDGRVVQGASTLTMQLARVSFDLRERTLHRKVLEAMVARKIERRYTKEEILYFYMNRVYLGSGLYGVEAASRAYFGKEARELGLGEAAMLAGIIRAPNPFSPFRHYAKAERERDAVLDRMLAEGFVTEEEVNAVKAQTVAVLPQGAAAGVAEILEARERRRESYLMAAVRQELEVLLDEEEAEDGGLAIYTSFDLDLQAAAGAALERRLREVEQMPGYGHRTRAAFDAAHGGEEAPLPDYVQGAVMVIDNRTGAIRAMVGGRDYVDSRFNRAVQARRQAGSVFKPLVYAEAFDLGLLFPGMLVDDGPLRRGEIAWYPGEWSPRNSDGTFLGMQAAEVGLVRSRNTMTVRVGERVGYDGVAEMAERVGLGALTEAERTPQVYIGNLGTSLKALTAAYSAFPNGGYRFRPFVIERIEDTRGGVIYETKTVMQRVFSPGASWLTRRVLEKVVEPGGTAAAVRALGMRGAAGGKTGTTDGYDDAWFLGFTSRLTCGVWVGMDEPAKIVESGYGSRLALPVWVEVMGVAEELGYEQARFEEPGGVLQVDVCRLSGQLAHGGCGKMGLSYRAEVPEELVPRGLCGAHGEVLTDGGHGEERRGGGWLRGVRKWFGK